MANHSMGLLSDEIYNAIAQACRELINGQHLDQFPIDMIQGGARHIDQHECQRSHSQPRVRDYGTQAG